MLEGRQCLGPCKEVGIASGYHRVHHNKCRPGLPQIAILAHNGASEWFSDALVTALRPLAI